MGTTFTGTTPALTRDDILHTLGETRATGATVAWGDGTDSALVLWETGVGVTSATGFTSRINSAATAARTVTIPDITGTVVLGDGSGITSVVDFRSGAGLLSNKLGSDFSNSTVVDAQVTDFDVDGLEASTDYHFRFILRTRSAAAATGMPLRVTGPVETASVSYTVRTRQEVFSANAFDVDILMSAFLGTDSDEILVIEGLLTTTATTPTLPLGLKIRSETDTVAVTVKAGSLINLTKY